MNSPTPRAARLAPMPALALAVLFVSCSAIVTRFTQAAPIAVAGWRLLLAATLLLALPEARSGWRNLRRRDLLRTGLAALFLALHFGTWIASLRMLPVAVSVLVVSTHPMFVLLIRQFGGEVPTVSELAGVTFSLAGLALMQLDRSRTFVPVGPGNTFLGLMLALVGAAALAGYLLVGASVRKRLHTPSYLLLVNGIAAVALFAFLFGAGGAPMPAHNSEFLLYLALALVPTIGGHGLFAYAVGHVRPVAVSVSFLGEPILAALMAIPVFGEVPGGWTLAGGVVTLIGLTLVVLRPLLPRERLHRMAAREPA